MKTLYLQCDMGAAGDMLTAALLDLREDPAAFTDRMNALGLPGVRVSAAPVRRCGILGTGVSVQVDGAEEGEHHAHDHHHVTLGDIETRLGALDLPRPVREDALAVFRSLAEAEGHVHGRVMEQIHFHEVGTLDAVADIVGVCLLMHELAPERVIASPVHVGSGQVRCAHGVLPVPTPATAWLLRGIPAYGGAVAGELCTPTGAALLRHFVDEFGPMPAMRTERIGYGMGKKEFESANCVRAFWGETAEETDEVAELRCSVDDMTGEDLAFACETLLEARALDVYTAPIGMKKGRPGVLVCCLCRREDREAMADLMLRHTTTLGVRETVCRRYVLAREEAERATPLGPVRVKTASGRGVRREKAAYEDRARLAREKGLTLAEVDALLQE
jgi:uncharacterized protein (TIGR00299 family) protein